MYTVNNREAENEYFSPLINKLDDCFQEALKKKIFPGAAVGISVGLEGQKKGLVLGYGTTTLSGKEKNRVTDQVFFDLASLTKPLVTTLLLLVLHKEKKIGLDQTLDKLLEHKEIGRAHV